MVQLKCKNCGVNMLAYEKNEYAVCEYCSATQKIEKSDAAGQVAFLWLTNHGEYIASPVSSFHLEKKWHSANT